MNTIFNKQIDIAIANSRFDTHLQNKTLSWSEFIDKCKIPTKTNETIQEYYSFSKDKQANIKDVGGFVGGFLVDGKRSKDTVAYRTVIALDADENAGGCWNNFTNSYPSINAMIYSTHRHTPEAPRMRLINSPWS